MNQDQEKLLFKSGWNRIECHSKNPNDDSGGVVFSGENISKHLD